MPRTVPATAQINGEWREIGTATYDEAGCVEVTVTNPEIIKLFRGEPSEYSIEGKERAEMLREMGTSPW